MALDGAGVEGSQAQLASSELSSLSASPTRVYIAQDHVVRVNNTITVPVQMHVNEDFGIQLTGVDLTFSYDTTQFTVSNVRAGSALSGFGSTSGSSTPGTIRFTASRATAVSYPFDFNGPLVLFNITPIAGPGTVSNLNLRISDGAFSTALFDENGQQLPLNPTPTNGSTDEVDGKITVSTIARNPNIPEDVDADTHVSSVDLVWVVAALNGPASQSPGPPGQRLFLDVNGDNSVSGFDLVSVVAKLNSGTSPLQLTSNSTAESGDDVSGLAFGISAFASANHAPASSTVNSGSAQLPPALVDIAISDFETLPVVSSEGASSTRNDLNESNPDDDESSTTDSDLADPLDANV